MIDTSQIKTPLSETALEIFNSYEKDITKYVKFLEDSEHLEQMLEFIENDISYNKVFFNRLLVKKESFDKYLPKHLISHYFDSYDTFLNPDLDYKWILEYALLNVVNVREFGEFRLRFNNKLYDIICTNKGMEVYLGGELQNKHVHTMNIFQEQLTIVTYEDIQKSMVNSIGMSARLQNELVLADCGTDKEKETWKKYGYQV